MHMNTIINILDNQESGIIILSKNKEVLYANKKAKGILGNDTNQLLGNYFNCEYTIREKTNCQITSGCDRCRINMAINNVIKTEDTEMVNNVEINKNNNEIKLSMKISLCEEYILVEIFNLCINNSKKDLLIKLADKSKDIILFKDKNLKYFYINKAYADFLNIEEEYIIGKTDDDLVEENILNRDLYEQCISGDKEALEIGYYDGVEVIGEKYFRVYKENIDGGILCTARDITSEMDAIKKSETDKLTGVYNRHKFESVINEIYLNNKDRYYLALIDLDDLRGLNNIYGHLKGDIYIRALGTILKLQRDAIFFRIGGDEFVALIDASKSCPREVFKDVFKDIDSLNLSPKLSISVGIKKLDLSKTYEKNYELVDEIMYKAKKSGKNKFIINYDK